MSEERGHSREKERERGGVGVGVGGVTGNRVQEGKVTAYRHEWTRWRRRSAV